MIGTIGAYDYHPGGAGAEESIEVGLSIRRDFWGRGFAREALQAVLTYLTEEEGICCVTAWSAADNIGSRRAMEHAGMRQTFFEQGALKVGSHIYDRVTYEYRIPVDLTFKVKGGTFNYRVGAVIIHNGKLLLMKNAEEPYYYTVGGRVRFNETTEETVVREVREEIGVSLKIDRFLFFQEQFFDGKVTGTHIHELGVYYLMKDSPDLENLECHSVTARGVAEELCWIPLEETGKYYIVPESVAQRLRDLPDHAEHLIEIDER
jgi:ADP-ribose pyrophosphatase YjhB (NUDIX family)